VGFRAGLDVCGKSRPQRDSIPGKSKYIIKGQQKQFKMLRRYAQ